MNQYPCGWIFSYFPDENQASYCCYYKFFALLSRTIWSACVIVGRTLRITVDHET